MINLTLNNKLYKLPTNFSELYIKDYEQIIDIYNDTKMDNLEKMVYTINILTGIDIDTIYTIDLEQIKFMNNSLQFIFKNDQGQGLIEIFEIDGIVYGFDNELNMMSLSQYIDLDTFSNKETINENLHMLMAILYRPIVKSNHKKFSYISYIKHLIKKDKLYYRINEYDINSVKERAEIFKEKMTMDIVLSSVLFFSILKNAFTMISNGCSNLTQVEAEMKKMYQQ